MMRSGFRQGRALDAGKAAMLRWMQTVVAAPPGAHLEIGLTWDAEHHWRVYQCIGESILMLASDEARALHRIYEKLGKKPEWRHVAESLRATIGELGTLAREAYQKNQTGEVPPDGVTVMPARGRA